MRGHFGWVGIREVKILPSLLLSLACLEYVPSTSPRIGSHSCCSRRQESECRQDGSLLWPEKPRAFPTGNSDSGYVLATVWHSFIVTLLGPEPGAGFLVPIWRVKAIPGCHWLGEGERPREDITPTSLSSEQVEKVLGWKDLAGSSWPFKKNFRALLSSERAVLCARILCELPLLGAGPWTKRSSTVVVSFYYCYLLFPLRAVESFWNAWHPSRPSEIRQEQSLPLQTEDTDMQRQAVQRATLEA